MDNFSYYGSKTCTGNFNMDNFYFRGWKTCTKKIAMDNCSLLLLEDMLKKNHHGQLIIFATRRHAYFGPSPWRNFLLSQTVHALESSPWKPARIKEFIHVFAHPNPVFCTHKLRNFFLRPWQNFSSMSSGRFSPPLSMVFF